MADRFGLDKLRDGVQNKADELSEDANVRSYDDRGRVDDGPFKPFTFQQEDFDRTEPDKDDMRKYWRQFETTPFVRKSITSFARQVMEPGYYIQARGLDEDQLTDLDNWLTQAAIIEGEPGEDFRQLAKKAIVQQEVRGTAFIEKAPDGDDPDKVAGLKLINAETMEAVTRPGQSRLLDPEDIEEYEDAPEAETGGAAAWLQDLGETDTFFATPISGRNRGIEDSDKDDDFKIGFRRDEIIKMSRDADAGELFGTSRLEAVSDRIDGLRQKLCDNDDAIASKAYPLWLFLFGSEDNPWESDDINEFMKSHEMENFHAGMKQGVRGDVSVETVSGEVADIADALQFDINWIMSIMPVPMYMLGAFQEGAQVGQFGGIAQQQETQRQIKDTRRDLEDKFTPLLREIAEQQGLPEDAVDTIRLKVGSPGAPEPETTPRENIIRYVPKDQRDPTPSQPDEGGPTTSPGNDGLPSGAADRQDLPEGMRDTVNPTDAEREQDAPEEAGAQLWHTGQGIAQLGLASDSQLSDAIYRSMVETRDNVLSVVGNEFENAPMYAASHFEQKANSELRKQMSRGRFRDDVKPVVEELVEGDESGFTRSNSVKFFTQNIENATEDALEEMLRLMRIQVRRGANNGEELDNVLERVKNKYNDAKLRERAELIAHMESKNITETVALQQYERDPDVIGVRVSNENPSTPLTQSLANAEAYFEDGDIQEQLMAQTRSEFLQKGFDPLPTTPPFHFNDTTTLEPIYE
jgi:hypothetical protein